MEDCKLGLTITAGVPTITADLHVDPPIVPEDPIEKAEEVSDWADATDQALQGDCGPLWETLLEKCLEWSVDKIIEYAIQLLFSLFIAACLIQY